jgi:hypothetical protein
MVTFFGVFLLRTVLLLLSRNCVGPLLRL